MARSTWWASRNGWKKCVIVIFHRSTVAINAMRVHIMRSVCAGCWVLEHDYYSTIFVYRLLLLFEHCIFVMNHPHHHYHQRKRRRLSHSLFCLFIHLFLSFSAASVIEYFCFIHLNLFYLNFHCGWCCRRRRLSRNTIQSEWIHWAVVAEECWILFSVFSLWQWEMGDSK